MSEEKPTCERCGHFYHTSLCGHWTTRKSGKLTSCKCHVISTEPEVSVSDQTPDLRERIVWALANWIAEVTVSDDSDRFDANRGAELVLSALGEKK